MHQRISSKWGMAAVVAGILAGLLAWPGAGSAQLLPDPTQLLPNPIASPTQAVTGQAAAVRATVLGLLGGNSTALADTGPAQPMRGMRRS